MSNKPSTSDGNSSSDNYFDNDLYLDDSCVENDVDLNDLLSEQIPVEEFETNPNALVKKGK